MKESLGRAGDGPSWYAEAAVHLMVDCSMRVEPATARVPRLLYVARSSMQQLIETTAMRLGGAGKQERLLAQAKDLLRAIGEEVPESANKSTLARALGKLDAGQYSEVTIRAHLGDAPVQIAMEDAPASTQLRGLMLADDADRTRAALQQVARMLKSLHESLRLTHGDLHSENVMFDADGQAWVVDFGQAWVSFGDGDFGLELPKGRPRGFHAGRDLFRLIWQSAELLVMKEAPPDGRVAKLLRALLRPAREWFSVDRTDEMDGLEHYEENRESLMDWRGKFWYKSTVSAYSFLGNDLPTGSDLLDAYTPDRVLEALSVRPTAPRRR